MGFTALGMLNTISFTQQFQQYTIKIWLIWGFVQDIKRSEYVPFQYIEIRAIAAFHFHKIELALKTIL